MLSADERTRYARHLSLPRVGVQGQERLKDGAVLIVGAGGLGGPLALYLAAAGVGRIGIVDFDVVEESNLQRQVLYRTDEIGRPKVERAAERMSALNPHTKIELHPTQLTRENALDLIGRYDVVADGTDNFATRYLVNDACVLLGKPDVYGSISRFEGQVSVFGTTDGPCYRCLYDTPPPPELVPSCAEGGVLGVLPGLVGTIQATEVLKLLLGIGESLAGRLLLIDALEMKFRELQMARDPSCPVCGEAPTITELVDYEAFCSRGGAPVPVISPTELKWLLESERPPVLLDVRSEEEFAESNLGGELLPLHQLRDRLGELEHLKRRPVVVHCRSGARSEQAVRILREAGFEDVTNLEGGLLAWVRDIGASRPQLG